MIVMKTPLLILAAISVFAFSSASVSANEYIYQGWNMVSFSADYSKITACYDDNQSDKYSDLYNILQNWNPSTSKFDSVKLSDMPNNIKAGKGYWIYKFSPGSCYLVAESTKASNSKNSINLKAGWNMIGIGGIFPGTSVALNEYKGNCAIDTAYSPVRFDASGKRWFLTDTLYFYGGYYIWVNKECTLQKTCAAQGGTCRVWDPLFGNCYSNEKEIGAAECSNNLAQTRCCVPK